MDLDAFNAAVEDFTLALGHGAGGAQQAAEASSVLRSYVEELQQAPSEALEALVEPFKTHLSAAWHWGLADAQATLQLHQELEALLAPHPALCSCLWAAWEALLPIVLHGRPAAGTASHLRMLECLHPALPLVIQSCAGMSSTSLWQLATDAAAPAGSESARQADSGSGFVGVLYLYMFCTQPGASGATDSELLPVLQQLLSVLVPQLFGSDPATTEDTTQRAFTAVLTVLQSETVRARLGGMAEGQRRAACGRALRFLQCFQVRPSPLAADIWWSVFGAVVHQLVAVAQQGRGAAALQHPQIAPLLRTLCAGSTAELLVGYLLVHPAHAEAKDGPRKAFGLAAALLQHDMPALLVGCAAVLRPESNHVLAVRIEALAAMNKACDAYLSSVGNDKEAHLRLWTYSSLQSLIFALNKDPSIRIRREAIQLLTSVAARVGSIEEQQLLHTICLRCRDRDEQVREAALKMLLQFPASTLKATLEPEEWFLILDLGLMGAGGNFSGFNADGGAEAGRDERALPLAPAGSKSRTGANGGGKGSSKHAEAIRELAQALLARYLFPEEGRCPAAAAAVIEVSGSEQPVGWLARLETLRRHLNDPAVQPGLKAAYAAALQQLITPEMVMRAARHAR